MPSAYYVHSWRAICWRYLCSCSLRYDDLTIFKMATVRHVGFKKNQFFYYVVFVGMRYCLLIQNFAEIGHSVDELWPKKRFSRWMPPPSWILKTFNFGHVTTIGFNICCSVPNYTNVGQYLYQLNSTQLTTPKEEWINKRKEAKKLIYIPDFLVNSQDVS